MHKILLVEDDVEISEMVSVQLGKEGFDLVKVFDGEEAIYIKIPIKYNN